MRQAAVAKSASQLRFAVSRGQARTLPEFAEKKAVCKGNRRRRGKDSFLKNRELALSQVRALRSRALTAASFFSDLVQRLRRKILGVIPLLLGAAVLTIVLAAIIWALTPILPQGLRETLRHVQAGDWAASRAELSLLFDGLGRAAPFAFMGVQFLQVLFAPIPGQVMGLLGGYLFGFWQGLLLTMVGLGLGSFVAMVLGRLLGERLVRKVVPASIMERFDYLIAEGGLWNFLMLFLLPALPDDAICFIAGLTRWRIWHLLAVCLAGRLPGMAVLTFVGASVGGEMAVANVLLGIAMVAAAALWLYSDEAEAFFARLSKSGVPDGPKTS